MIPRWQRKLNLSNRTGWRESSGNVVIITGICLLVIMGMAGLALDLGHFFVVKSGLQRAADAGALAGARALYPTTLDDWVKGQTPLCAGAVTAATAMATANLVDGSEPTVSSIQTGSWNFSTSAFTANCSTSPFTNAVKVTVQRIGISMMFMGAFGYGPTTLTANSLAVKDWVGRLHNDSGGNNPVGQRFPLAINTAKAQIGSTFLTIKETATDGGWCAIYPTTINAALINGYLTNPNTVPEWQTTLLTGPATALRVVNDTKGTEWNPVWINLASYIGKVVWLPVITYSGSAPYPIKGFTAFYISACSFTARTITGIACKLQEAPGTVSDPVALAAPVSPTYVHGLVTSPRVVQ